MRTLTILPVVILSALTVAAPGCSKGGAGNERWVTTENTNVKIDFDKINEAFKEAEGPEDFEKRVNEIYEGSEVISVAVHDVDAKTQVVTGFFDTNSDGAVQDPEKVFSIRRDITGEGTGQYQVSGYGHYGYYHSPMMGLASGMIMGSMLSSAFRPNYVPMYTQPYTTPPARASAMGAARSVGSKATPSGGSKPSPGTGRRYGGGSRPGGGSRFGIRRNAGSRTPARLAS